MLALESQASIFFYDVVYLVDTLVVLIESELSISYNASDFRPNSGA